MFAFGKSGDATLTHWLGKMLAYSWIPNAVEIEETRTVYDAAKG